MCERDWAAVSGQFKKVQHPMALMMCLSKRSLNDSFLHDLLLNKIGPLIVLHGGGTGGGGCLLAFIVLTFV